MGFRTRRELLTARDQRAVNIWQALEGVPKREENIYSGRRSPGMRVSGIGERSSRKRLASLEGSKREEALTSVCCCVVFNGLISFFHTIERGIELERVREYDSV